MRTPSVLRYSLLAYGISWLLTLPLVLQGLGRLPWEISPLWHGLGALGPVLAAFAMRRSADPSTRIGDLYRRQGERRLSPAWTGLVLLSPLLLLALGLAGVTLFAGAPDYRALGQALSRPEWLGSLFVGSVLYGLGEEPGWRGWLLPYLQEKRGAVTSTLLLSVIWAAWHAPFFFYRFDFGGPSMIVGFFIGLLAGAFWLTFVFNTTGGSVWTVAFWHVIWNVSNLVAAEISGTALAALNGLMMVLGYGVVAVWGGRNLTAGPIVEPAEGRSSLVN
jgi:membrane protease YdiL (CAAX protease family)